LTDVTRTAPAPRTRGLVPLVTQISLVALYVLLVVVPYFAYGLHRVPAIEVESGLYDPKGFRWPFDIPALGIVLSALMLLVGVLGWVFAGLACAMALFQLVTRKPRATRIRLAFAVALGAAFIAFQFSASGGRLSRWVLD
jgi:heme/copper-type cytochrome/quinol oxidase subunit 3